MKDAHVRLHCLSLKSFHLNPRYGYGDMGVAGSTRLGGLKFEFAYIDSSSNLNQGSTKPSSPFIPYVTILNQFIRA